MIKRTLHIVAFVTAIAIQFTYSQSICETPLTKIELDELAEKFRNPLTGIVLFEHFGEEVGYFYEFRTNCPNVFDNGPLPPGFSLYGGTFVSCDGELICTYGFDRPIPCNAELNPIGLDLTRATQRTFILSTPCEYDGSVITSCKDDIVNISIPKTRPVYPNQPGLPVDSECLSSTISVIPDDNISFTEDGFRIEGPTSSRYEVTLSTNQADCSPLSFVYTIREDQTCDDRSDMPEIFDRYPFLNNLIDFRDCGNSSVTVYDLNGNIFVFVTTNESQRLYLADGTLYCTNSSSLSCEETYGLSQIIDQWECQAIEEGFIFASICPGDPLPLYRSRYTLGENIFQGCGAEGPAGSPPRICPCQTIFSIEISPQDGVISDLIDRNSFEIVPEVTTTYTIVARTGGAPDNPCIRTEFTEVFTIVVRSPEECSDCICPAVFDPVCGEDGVTYSNECEARCNNVNIISRGECASSENCTMASGTIVFEPCDDGRTFFFVRTGSGNLFDLYFAAGIEFEVFEGQEISFDFELADFDSPCSIADAAIIASCIQDITRPNDCSDNSGTFFFEECSGQTFFLLETDDGRILDTYFEDGPTIDIVEGLRVRFDYFLADFTTPCTIAESAVFLTCVEENLLTDQEDLLLELEAFALSLIDEDDCNSNDLAISIFETRGEFVAYIRSSNVGTLYDQRGNFLCSDGESISCLSSFNLRNPVREFNCSAFLGTGDAIVEFEDYPWINERVDQTNCNDGSFVEIYENIGYAFVFIDLGSGGILYDEFGGLYCTDSPSLSCREVYGLNEATLTWTCGESFSNDNSNIFKEESNVIQQPQTELNAYPNPATNELFLSGLTQKHKSLNILDVHGRIVWQATGIISPKIDLSTFETGIYILSIQEENGQIENIKFIIQK